MFNLCVRFAVSKVGEQCDAVDPPVPRKLRSGTNWPLYFFFYMTGEKGFWLPYLFFFRYTSISDKKHCYFWLNEF
jgi:hypothetical protein